MTIHACGSDGQIIGEFEEQAFLDAVANGRLPPDGYYWHEGMPDWKPLSEYRALAKTQRISFAPPPKPKTVLIDMDSADQGSQARPAKSQTFFGRLWQRLSGRG